MRTASVVARPAPVATAAADAGAGIALAWSEPRRTPSAPGVAQPIGRVLKRVAALLAAAVGTRAADIESDPCWLAWEVAVLD